jgi:hypothetical protein
MLLPALAYRLIRKATAEERSCESENEMQQELRAEAPILLLSDCVLTGVNLRSSAVAFVACSKEPADAGVTTAA